MLRTSVGVILVLLFMARERGESAPRDELDCLEHENLGAVNFIENLGHRNESDSQQFWLRYSLPDGTTRNMKCVKRPEGWRRDSWAEQVSILNSAEKRAAIDAAFANHEFGERLSLAREAVLADAVALPRLDREPVTTTPTIRVTPLKLSGSFATLGTIEFAAPYDNAIALKVLKRHQNELNFCYQLELQRGAIVRGNFTAIWTIDASGSVVSPVWVSPSSTFRNANIEGCFRQRIARWKFPEPRVPGDVVVRASWALN